MTYAADTSLTATLKVTVKEAEPVDTVPLVISGADTWPWSSVRRLIRWRV